MHIPSVYLLTYPLICPHNALVSQLKPVPGFRACFQNILCIRCIDSLAISSVLQPYSMFPDFLNEKRFARFIYYIIILVPPPWLNSWLRLCLAVPHPLHNRPLQQGQLLNLHHVKANSRRVNMPFFTNPLFSLCEYRHNTASYYRGKTGYLG